MNKLLALTLILAQVCVAHSSAIAEVIIDDHGNACGPLLTGEDVMLAGQILADAAPRLNFRLIIADKVNRQWEPRVLRSVNAAITRRQIPVLITCSNDAPRAEVRVGGRVIGLAWISLTQWTFTQGNRRGIHQQLDDFLELPSGVKAFVPAFYAATPRAAHYLN